MERDGYADQLTIKEYLQGKHISQKLFYATFEEHNERMAQLVGIEFDAVTLSRYRLCLRYFKEMMARKTKVVDFPIKNLNGEMIRNFEAFLKIEKRVAQNTMIRYKEAFDNDTARYTFATTITLANNVKLENVSKMLGHTNTRMTLHYAHIMNDSLAQEMNKVAAIVGE